MLKLLRLTLLLFFVSYVADAQVKIEGKIVDSKTKEPIPGVFIQSLEQKNGSLSNEEGEFSLNVSKLPVTVLVSHLSYGKKQMEIKDKNFLNLNLDLAAISLPEFSTGNPAVALLRAAIKNAEDDSAKVQNFNAFYQMTSRFKGRYTKLQEMFFEVSWTTTGVKKWKPQNTRYANKDYQGFRTQNQIAETFVFIEVYRKHLVFPLNSKNITANYKFSIKEILNENAENEITIIKCEPKNKKKTPLLRYEGDIYIFSKSKRIARILGVYTRYSKKWKNEKKVDMSFTGIQETVPNYLHMVDVSSKRNGLASNQENVWVLFKEEIPSLSKGKSYTHWEVKDDDEFFKSMPYDEQFWSKTNIPLKHTKQAEEVLKYIIKKDNYSTNISK